MLNIRTSLFPYRISSWYLTFKRTDSRLYASDSSFNPPQCPNTHVHGYVGVLKMIHKLLSTNSTNKLLIDLTDWRSGSEMSTWPAADEVCSCSERDGSILQSAGGDRNITEVGECLSGTWWLTALSYCILSYSATKRRPGAPSLRHWL